MVNMVSLLRSQYDALMQADQSLAEVRRVIESLKNASGSIHGGVVDEVRRSTAEWLEAAIEGRLDPHDPRRITSPAAATTSPAVDPAEDPAPPTVPEWGTEWAVEVTWQDWEKAGAKGPTSQYGPFENPEHRDRFLEEQRRDREVAATRVLTRHAAYTPWTGPDAVDPTSAEEREALLIQQYERMGFALPPTGGTDA